MLAHLRRGYESNPEVDPLSCYVCHQTGLPCYVAHPIIELSPTAAPQLPPSALPLSIRSLFRLLNSFCLQTSQFSF